MKFYRLASGFPTKSGSLLPTKRGRELPTLTLSHVMVLIGTERDKLKHLFVGSSPVPRTTKKALKLKGFKAFSFA